MNLKRIILNFCCFSLFAHLLACGDSSPSSASDISLSPGSGTPAGLTTGLVTDSRDNQTYKTVKIGKQIWMAQNLNFATNRSSCYNNDSLYCNKYGRLYNWMEAIDGYGLYSANAKGCNMESSCWPTPTFPVRGICPEGWHLPTNEEWMQLFDAVGGKDVAGTALKSTNGWKDDDNGTDAFGFSALPAGQGGLFSEFYTEGMYADFWSSTEFLYESGSYVYLQFNYTQASTNSEAKTSYLSVRCVKD
jgi:uncharacterized protein (TIGR02145 family)